MDKLPNIVRQRLAAQVPAGAHPDADQLAAFAEQRLAGAERSNVLAHLVACADCREIVALAAPESIMTAPITAGAGSRSRWWTMPAFQWGAAATAMAAIALGLVVRNPAEQEKVTQTRQSTSVARTEPQTPTAQPEEAGTKAKESDKVASTDVQKQSPAVGYLSPRRDRAVGKGFGVGGFRTKPDIAAEKNAQQKSKTADEEYAFALKDQAALSKNSPPSSVASKPAAATETVEVTSAANAVNKPETEQKADLSSSRIAAAAPEPVVAQAERTEVQDAKNVKTLPKVTGATSPAYAGAVTGNVLAARAADELATGQAGPAVQRSRAKMETASQVSKNPFRIANGRLQRYDAGRNSWDDVSVSTTARLSIVANLANEVWVGGTDGTMFYSNDLGAHWLPVHTGGWSKDATITGLTPTARQSVEVYLSNGERWRSADAGASWTRYQ